MNRKIVIAALVMLIAPFLGASEFADPIPLNLQIPIFLKIMTYDRSINLAEGESFKVGLVLSDKSEGDEAFQEVKKILEEKTILRHPIVLSPIYLKTLDADLAAVTPHILIISSFSEEKLLSVLNYCKNHKIMTFGTDPDFLKVNVGVVLTLESGKPLINLNLLVAKEAGADFDANFLKHCRVIR